MPRPRLEELGASGLDARSAELLVVLVWLVAGELELDRPDRRAALAAALDRLAADAAGLPVVSAALAALRGEPDLAWGSLALALLADELADE